ncbi:MAG: hypothetical protein U9Q19_11660, partial [Pseudomonadota bacterium]|nr:hypothetical protein [Pseudomonadota bacterium]
IEEAMMKAMWPRMKKQFLEEEKMYLAAKSCFDSANTVKEANIMWFPIVSIPYHTGAKGIIMR